MTAACPVLDCGHPDDTPDVAHNDHNQQVCDQCCPTCTGMARTATGIDLDESNAALAIERCGMFLDVDHGTEGVVA